MQTKRKHLPNSINKWTCTCDEVCNTYVIDNGNWKGQRVAYCPDCDIEFFFKEDGGEIVVVS